MIDCELFYGPMSPCLDCARREIGCHDECAAYAAFKARRCAYLDATRRENEARVLLSAGARKAAKKKHSR